MRYRFKIICVALLLCVACGSNDTTSTPYDTTTTTTTASTPTEPAPTEMVVGTDASELVRNERDEEESATGKVNIGSVSPSQGNLYEVNQDGSFRTSDNPEVPVLRPGVVIATTTFLPQLDGFSFPNYGNDGVVNLQAMDMQRIFGDKVCARFSDGKCVLTPNAKAWMKNTNQEMSGGHCYGFALLSEVFYLKQLNQTDYGAETTFDLTLDGNKQLQREIAVWMANQFTEPQNAEQYQDEIQQYGWGMDGVTAKPMELVERLKNDFVAIANGGVTGDLYVLSIFQPGYQDGHAIMPFAIKQNDDGTLSIMVYDNNFPAQAREVVVNPETNEWSYDTSINPSEPVQPYQGNADTYTMFLSRVSHAQDLPRRCDFCSGETSTADGVATGNLASTAVAYNELSVYGNVTMLIVDTAGNRSGFVDGQLVNEIPGVRYQPTVSANLWEDDPSSNWKIPQNIDVYVQLSGDALTEDELSDISLIGPGYTLAVEELMFSPGQQDVITFAGNGQQIRYDTNASDTPYLTLIYETEQNDYAFEVQVSGENNGQNVQLLLDPDKQQFAVTTNGRDDTASYTLYMARYSETDTEEFDTEYSLEQGVTDYIAYGEWQGNGTPLTIHTDLDGDGVFDESVDAADVSN